MLEVQRDACDGAACACACDEGVEVPAGLTVDFWTGGGEVREVVVVRFELVGEEAAAGLGGIRGVGCGEVACGVDEVALVDYWGGRETGYAGAEFEQERGLFGCLVVGHAAGGVGVKERMKKVEMGGEGEAYMCAR